MLTKEQIISKTWATIAELERGCRSTSWEDKLLTRLEDYAEVLDEDIPDDLVERLEEYIPI